MKLPLKLPIGIESFGEIRTEDFYYADKTGLIRELLSGWGKVNLFTRPRRFGKSLNMSMLKYFFEYDTNSMLFDGLEIAREQELCEMYMGKFPVISISLKGVDAKSFEAAEAKLCTIIGNEAMRFPFLLKSDRLNTREKARYEQLVNVDTSGQQGFIMPQEVLTDSLRLLSELLHKHYGQKVILLIDEYDVPLDKAHNAGYYDEMLDLIRALLGQALKTNDSLYFAVLTGCLRISKESVFTGLNNLKVFSIMNVRFNEYFGFSSAEVKSMLEYYKLGDKFETVKEWYDGYRFGNADIYCPWDVLSYIDLLRSEPDTPPQAFWANTSGNDIIRTFLQKANQGTRRDIETLIDGGTIRRKISQELTYRDLYRSIDNLWSVLFTTGYLTQHGAPEGKVCQLVIPNLEVREIFVEQIQRWFQEETEKDAPALDAFCAAFPQSDAETVEKQFNAYLDKSISIRDTGVRREYRENFYHGILLGLLSHRGDWLVSSNDESGEGYSDILVEINREGVGIVIEVKYADGGNLDKGCADALEQIERKRYEAKLREDGMETILKYGVACYKKRCRVRLLA